MAKKTKSSRRARAQKQQPSKTKPAASKQAAEAVIIAEGSDEPVMKVSNDSPAPEVPESTPESPTEQIKAPVEPRAEEPDPRVADEPKQAINEEDVRPHRRRAIINAIVLSVVVVSLTMFAISMRQPQNTDTNQTPAGQSSSKADEISQSGGSVCANGGIGAQGQGSADPNSVGMMLQSVPTQDFQSTQTLGAGSDAATLQGAACF